MIRSRFLFPGLAILAVLSGCASRPHRVKPLGLVDNKAGALYAYGTQPAGSLVSETVEVEVLVPVPMYDDLLAAARLRGDLHAARLSARLAKASATSKQYASTNRSGLAEPNGWGEFNQPWSEHQFGVVTNRVGTGVATNVELVVSLNLTTNAVGPGRREGSGAATQADSIARPELTNRVVQPLVQNRGAQPTVTATNQGPKLDDQAARGNLESANAVPTGAATDAASTGETTDAASILKAGTAGANIATVNVGAQTEISEADSRNKALVARPGLDQKTHAPEEQANQHAPVTGRGVHKPEEKLQAAAPVVRSWERMPTLTKRASRLSVLVEDEFEYVVTLTNASGLPLDSVEVNDLLDPWLQLKLKKVWLDGPGKLRCRIDREGFLIATVKGPVPRGGILRLHLPVVASVAQIRASLGITDPPALQIDYK